MLTERNDSERIRLRRYSDRLAICGGGVIMFSLWNVMRIVLFAIAQPHDLISTINMDEFAGELEEALLANSDLSASMGAADLRSLINAVIIGFFFLFFACLLLPLFYMGRSAIVDGRGLKRKTPVYILVALLAAALLTYSLCPRVVTIIREFMAAPPQADALDTFDILEASFIFDLTNDIAIIELIYCAIRTRLLRKKLGIIVERGKKVHPLELLTDEMPPELIEEAKMLSDIFSEDIFPKDFLPENVSQEYDFQKDVFQKDVFQKDASQKDVSQKDVLPQGLCPNDCGAAGTASENVISKGSADGGLTDE